MAKYNAADIISQYNFDAFKGRGFDPGRAVVNFYRKNFTILQPGLEEIRDRLKLPATTDLFTVFYDSLDTRIEKSKYSDPRNIIKDAIINTIVKDVHRSEITKRGYMSSWSAAVGGPDLGKRGRGRPRKISELWKQWVSDSGWTGSIDDYKRLEHSSGNKFIYTSLLGDQFELSFTISGSSGVVADYKKI